MGDWRKADPSNHRGRAWGQVLMTSLRAVARVGVQRETSEGDCAVHSS